MGKGSHFVFKSTGTVINVRLTLGLKNMDHRGKKHGEIVFSSWHLITQMMITNRWRQPSMTLTIIIFILSCSPYHGYFFHLLFNKMKYPMKMDSSFSGSREGDFILEYSSLPELFTCNCSSAIFSFSFLLYCSLECSASFVHFNNISGKLFRCVGLCAKEIPWCLNL